MAILAEFFIKIWLASAVLTFLPGVSNQMHPLSNDLLVNQSSHSLIEHALRQASMNFNTNLPGRIKRNIYDNRQWSKPVQLLPNYIQQQPIIPNPQIYGNQQMQQINPLLHSIQQAALFVPPPNINPFHVHNNYVQKAVQTSQSQKQKIVEVIHLYIASFCFVFWWPINKLHGLIMIG